MLNYIQVFDLTLPAIKKSAKLSALLDSKKLNIGKMDILIVGIILANGYCELDLHDYELWEALEEILYYLEECQTMGIREISIIHGYHGGKVLTPPVKKHYNIIVPNSESFFNFLLSYILI